MENRFVLMKYNAYSIESNYIVGLHIKQVNGLSKIMSKFVKVCKTEVSYKVISKALLHLLSTIIQKWVNNLKIKLIGFQLHQYYSNYLTGTFTKWAKRLYPIHTVINFLNQTILLLSFNINVNTEMNWAITRNCTLLK